jgi:translation initiation factor 3 subunit A
MLLQRAQELIAVEQSTAALTILHEHVTSKRSRNSPITSLEPVMVLFVELCVDLKKGKLAKDGLYQYKNTAQNTNVGTIEVSRAPSFWSTSPANVALFVPSLSSRNS